MHTVLKPTHFGSSAREEIEVARPAFYLESSALLQAFARAVSSLFRFIFIMPVIMFGAWLRHHSKSTVWSF